MVGQMEDIVAMIMIPAMFVSIVWIIFSTVRRYKIAKLQAELRSRLLEKFGTGQELLGYLQTEDGRKFLESATIEQNHPFNRILGAIQAGTILTLVGLALLLVRNHVGDIGPEVLLAFGAVLLSIGLGFLISAAASYALSKSHGVLPSASESRL